MTTSVGKRIRAAFILAAAAFIGACGDDEPDNKPTPEPIAVEKAELGAQDRTAGIV